MYGPGSVVGGKYRVDRVIGQGGMGTVVAATHLQLGTPVALKFLHQDMVANRDVVDRFMREARASAQLRGENVCRVSDVGATETGVPYIVMELLAGQDLATVLKTNGAVPVAMAAEILLQACLAVGEAHSVGIVHRDLKPGNLFWTQRPDGTACIKVLDFGVAKAPDEVNFSLTQTASVIGSPGYMSPEQLKSSKGVDARSDIWSLGVVLYELVSAMKPFQGESITELALRVAMDPTPALTGLVPRQFEQIVQRCLEKDPTKRYTDVAELAQSLASFVGPRGNELAYAVARVVRGANTPMAPMPPVASTPTTLRGANAVIATEPVRTTRKWKVPAIIAIGAASGVAIAMLILAGGNKKSTAAANEPAGETTRMMTTTSADPAGASAAGAKPETKVESASAAKADPRTDPAAAATAETKVDSATAAKTESKTNAATTATAETKTNTATSAKAETKTNAATSATTETKAAAASSAKAEPKVETKFEAKVATQAATKSTTSTKSSGSSKSGSSKSASSSKSSGSSKSTTKSAATKSTTKAKGSVEDLSDSRY